MFYDALWPKIYDETQKIAYISFCYRLPFNSHSVLFHHGNVSQLMDTDMLSYHTIPYIFLALTHWSKLCKLRHIVYDKAIRWNQNVIILINFHHWLHQNWTCWQFLVWPVIKISSKWWHFGFIVLHLWNHFLWLKWLWHRKQQCVIIF